MPDMTPYSSPWWLERLGKKLDERDRRFDVFERYYRGDQPFPLASRKFEDAFRAIFRGFSDNFCRLVIQAVEERLTVDGFRWNDAAGSRKAWRLWQANQLDAQSQKAHREALIKSEALVIVGPDPNDRTSAIIRVQEPEHVVVAYEDDPLVRAVAMKRWKAIDGRVFATLYYPDRLEKYQQARQLAWANQYAREYTLGGWEPRIVEGEDWPLSHELGVVPVVPLVNDPDLENEGTSEIASVLPLQNALNKLLVDMLVASEFGAFRQRWATGMEIPVDPETNKPVEPFKSAVDHLWLARDPNVKFGEFEQTLLDSYVKAIETLIQHIASTTRTPPHYLLGQSGAFPSGESLKATETGLVAKARRRMRDFGEGWEEVIRLALRVTGDQRRSEYIEGETQWRDPEVRTEAEHVDALLKLSSLNVPDEQLWEDAGYTPQQIQRFTELRAAQPPGPTSPAPTGGVPMMTAPAGTMPPDVPA